MQAGEGTIYINESINAGENVSAKVVTKGDITVGAEVAAAQGSVEVKTKDGNIQIGENSADPSADTVTANQEVTLETENGQILVNGGVSTTAGDITVQTANTTYDPQGNGDSIAFGVNGQLTSGKDAYLIAKNGDLVVTDDVTAQGTFYAQTEVQGDIILGENLDVENDLSMSRCNGDAGQRGDAGR